MKYVIAPMVHHVYLKKHAVLLVEYSLNPKENHPNSMYSNLEIFFQDHYVYAIYHLRQYDLHN